MKLWRAALLLPILGLLFAAGGHAAADTSDFTVDDFIVNETLTRTDPQGELHVMEHINVTFNDYNHGITRAVPNRYKGNTLKFHLNSVTTDARTPTQVKQSSSNGNVVLRIGDPTRTVTGIQEYNIDYTLQNVISFYGDHDELYWDVNGDQWQQPFTRVLLTLNLPQGLQLFHSPQCFTGSFGSIAANCTIAVNGAVIKGDASNLTAHQTLTYVAGFDKGYFRPATFWERAADYEKPILEAVTLPVVVGGFSLIWWLRKGRDAKGRGTIIPEYTPPEDMTPLEAGTIADFKVDNRDITATYIDLARRGYLRIIENRQDRKIGKDKVTYTLELRKDDLAGLNTDETSLLTALFTTLEVGQVISLNELKMKLYKTATTLRKTVSIRLTTNGYFKSDPRMYAIKGSGVFIAAVVAFQLFGGALNEVGNLPFIGGLIVAIVLLLIFVRLMPARTAKGVAAREQLLGLKLYMETAEKDRIDKLEAPEAAYAANVGAPARTVELFEKLLPYAIVLGVENQWASKFNDIYKTPPDWYSGNWTAFNAGYLAGSLNSGFAPAVNSSFAAPSSSGSSGFGGGGFSGGGGGGGGGGGW